MGVDVLTGQKRKAVFLDRDGVLNKAIVRNGRPHPPASLAELQIEPEAKETLMALRGRGFLLVGVSNQPDVARGTQRRETVESINAALLAALPLDDLFVCYHDDPDGCDCRKPRAGLVLAAAAKYGIDPVSSFLIGDRWRDVAAGHAAGCTTVLIDHGYDDGGELERPPDRTVHSLSEAGSWILSRGPRDGEK